MKTQKIDAPNGAIAVHESGGQGPPVVLIHGNSSSSRVFSRQLEGPLGERFRLIAVDLPGHGASDDAEDPSGLFASGPCPSRFARLWMRSGSTRRISSGGASAVMSRSKWRLIFRAPRGFVIFGTPPLSPRGSHERCVPAQSGDESHFPEKRRQRRGVQLCRRVLQTRLRRYSAVLSRRCLAHGRAGARAILGRASSRAGARDEGAVVRDLQVPLAVLHGDEEQLVNGRYFGSVAMPTLWRGAVQMIADAGHTPQWETPQVFDALIEAFVEDTAPRH